MALLFVYSSTFLGIPASRSQFLAAYRFLYTFSSTFFILLPIPLPSRSPIYLFLLGKTSLVKTLSTLLSTASLDKSKQSRQRGMTLDLGFSCFFLPLPEHLQTLYPTKTQLQMTLVDCPGHASLIRTIIGGAQIIDMVLLVVDAYKGWQAQTTECLVLAELTSPHLVVALNKVDMFPEAEREERLKEAQQKVRRRLAKSRFPNAPMVGVSACIGGEKVAAVGGGTGVGSSSTSAATAASADTNSAANTVVATAAVLGNNATHNIDILVQTLQKSLPAPKRQPGNSSFYFAIDHCFPIKGMGTVLTGTCLSGMVKVNETIEFPTLGRMERKIKSMQMFKRKTQQIQQGDRAGICVSSLDSNLLERGIAAKPGTVQLLKGAIGLVRKIPYFPGTLKNGAKFHISVGHTTLMATVTFWGARELLEQRQLQQQQQAGTDEKEEDDHNVDGSALGGDADRAGLPYLKFDWNQDFLQQDHLLDSMDEASMDTPDGGEPSKPNTTTTTTTKTAPLLHWAVLNFQTPVYCPLNSLIIGSRLDAVENNAATTTTGNNAATTGLDTTAASSCRLAFCGRLVTPMDPTQDFSRIRWYNPKERRGTVSRLGDPHQRQDDGKIVRYEVFGGDLFKKETLLKPFLGMKLVTPQGDIGELKSAFGTSGKFRIYFPAGTTVREGEALVMPFKRFVHDAEKKMRQEDLILPKARPGSRIETTKGKKGANKGGGGAGSSNSKPEATGQIEKVKGDKLENGKYPQAIVAGFFQPQDDIRERVGQVVKIPSTGEQGTIAGAFGKAGKCKVAFEEGVSAEPGTKAELLPKH
jgi:selenocysteine-specific elongation factor